MSFLAGGYLDEMGADVDAGNATSALFPAPGDTRAPTDMISLPGGITLPRKTLWLIIGALAVAALVVYFRQRDDRLKHLEEEIEEDES